MTKAAALRVISTPGYLALSVLTLTACCRAYADVSSTISFSLSGQNQFGNGPSSLVFERFYGADWSKSSTRESFSVCLLCETPQEGNTGAIVDIASSGRVGIDLGFKASAGTVDATLPFDVGFDFSFADFAPNRSVTIGTRGVLNTGAARFSSISPDFSFAAGLALDVDVDLSATGCLGALGFGTCGSTSTSFGWTQNEVNNKLAQYGVPNPFRIVGLNADDDGDGRGDGRLEVLPIVTYVKALGQDKQAALSLLPKNPSGAPVEPQEVSYQPIVSNPAVPIEIKGRLPDPRAELDAAQSSSSELVATATDAPFAEATVDLVGLATAVFGKALKALNPKAANALNIPGTSADGSLSIPGVGSVGFGIDLLSADLVGDLAIGQELTLAPSLTMDLAFDRAVRAATGTAATATTPLVTGLSGLRPGTDSFSLFWEDGSALGITPTYRLGATLTNGVDLLGNLKLDLSALGGELKVEIGGDTLINESFGPVLDMTGANAVPIFSGQTDIFDTSFALAADAFAAVAGPALVLDTRDRVMTLSNGQIASWQENALWENGLVGDNGAGASLKGAGIVVLLSTDANNVGNLSVDSGVQLTVDGALTQDAGINTRSFTNAGNVLVVGEVTANAPVSGGGRIQVLGGGTLRGNLEFLDQDVVLGGGSGTPRLDARGVGLLLIGEAASLTATAPLSEVAPGFNAQLFNRGLVDVGSGATLNLGDFRNPVLARIRNTGGELRIDGRLNLIASSESLIEGGTISGSGLLDARTSSPRLVLRSGFNPADALESSATIIAQDLALEGVTTSDPSFRAGNFRNDGVIDASGTVYIGYQDIISLEGGGLLRAAGGIRRANKIVSGATDAGGGVLSIGPGQTVTGSISGLRVDNQGTIRNGVIHAAALDDPNIAPSVDLFNAGGTLQADGGTLVLRGGEYARPFGEAPLTGGVYDLAGGLVEARAGGTVLVEPEARLVLTSGSPGGRWVARDGTINMRPQHFTALAASTGVLRGAEIMLEGANARFVIDDGLVAAFDPSPDDDLSVYLDRIAADGVLRLGGGVNFEIFPNVLEDFDADLQVDGELELMGGRISLGQLADEMLHANPGSNVHGWGDIDAYVSNNSLITAEGAGKTLTIEGGIGGSGGFAVAPGATLLLDFTECGPLGISCWFVDPGNGELELAGNAWTVDGTGDAVTTLKVAGTYGNGLVRKLSGTHVTLNGANSRFVMTEPGIERPLEQTLTGVLDATLEIGGRSFQAANAVQLRNGAQLQVRDAGSFGTSLLDVRDSHIALTDASLNVGDLVLGPGASFTSQGASTLSGIVDSASLINVQGGRLRFVGALSQQPGGALVIDSDPVSGDSGVVELEAAVSGGAIVVKDGASLVAVGTNKVSFVDFTNDGAIEARAAALTFDTVSLTSTSAPIDGDVTQIKPGEINVRPDGRIMLTNNTALSRALIQVEGAGATSGTRFEIDSGSSVSDSEFVLAGSASGPAELVMKGDGSAITDSVLTLDGGSKLSVATGAASRIANSALLNNGSVDVLQTGALTLASTDVTGVGRMTARDQASLTLQSSTMTGGQLAALGSGNITISGLSRLADLRLEGASAVTGEATLAGFVDNRGTINLANAASIVLDGTQLLGGRLAGSAGSTVRGSFELGGADPQLKDIVRPAELVSAGDLQITGLSRVRRDGVLRVSGSAARLTLDNRLEVLDGAFEMGKAALGVADPSLGSLYLRGGSITIDSGAQIQGLVNLSAEGPGTRVNDVVVSGRGTRVDFTGRSPNTFTGMLLGFGGTTDVSINDGATVHVGGGYTADVASGLTLGANVPPELTGAPVPGIGKLTVTGADSTLSLAGPLIETWIGSATPVIAFLGQVGLPGLDNPGGNGELVVSNGARVLLQPDPGGASRIVVADDPDGVGSVLVTGTGSLLDAAQLMELGIANSKVLDPGGTASLGVADGGRVEVDVLRVGGPAAVTLAGGELVAGTMDLYGSLTANAGGEARVSGLLDVGDGGLARIAGGTLSAGQINLAGTLAFEQGLLELTGTDVRIGTGFGAPFGPALSLDPGQHLKVDRLMLVASEGLVTLNGGELSVGALSVLGAFKFNAGVLRITDSPLVVGGGGLLGGTLQLGAAQRVEVSQTTVVEPAGLVIVDHDVLASQSYVNAGEIVLTNVAARLGGDSLANSGLVRGEGRIAPALANAAGGEVRGESGKRLYFTGAGNANAGEVNLLGGTVEFAADLTNAAGGTISGQGTLIVDGGLANQGSLAFSGLASHVFGAVQHTGSIIVTGNAVVTFYDAMVNNGSEFRVSQDSLAVFLDAYSGASGFTGLGTVQFEGTTNAGNSPGLMRIEGDGVFGRGNTLVIELGGRSAGESFDVWEIGGTAYLGGTLQIDLVDGFTPEAGDSFEFLSAQEGLFGMFSQVLFPELRGRAFTLGSTGGGLTLGVSAAPVPLPGAAWLLGSALTGIAGASMRRRGAAPRRAAA